MYLLANVTDEDVKNVKIKIEKVKTSKVFLYLFFRVSFFTVPITLEIIDTFESVSAETFGWKLIDRVKIFFLKPNLDFFAEMDPAHV